MRAGNDEVNLVLDNEFLQRGPDVSFFQQDFVGQPPEFSGDQDVRDALFGGLPNFFVGGLGQLRFGKLERVRGNHVC